MHSDLEELAGSLRVIVSNEINVEAQENMMAFAINALGNTEGSIIAFLRDSKDVYTNAKPNVRMTFYCWLDELAGQIRMSAVSQSYEQLPFRCGINSLALIPFSNSLAVGISGVYSSEEKLNVWQSQI
ncbi:hypothetical protein [Pseudoalteromonas neustonica]|uniref:hypothetical protein n=1 Tax=Pseudoalteromonas neustonica TaxID=1840331 RepID=UPI0007DAFEE4|nr:hypothetical protein [Pseudoalteromonas neustonica]